MIGLISQRSPCIDDMWQYQAEMGLRLTVSEVRRWDWLGRRNVFDVSQVISKKEGDRSISSNGKHKWTNDMKGRVASEGDSSSRKMNFERG